LFCVVRRILPPNKQSGGLFTVRAAQGASPVEYRLFRGFKSRKAYAFGTTASTIKAEVTFVTSVFISWLGFLFLIKAKFCTNPKRL